MHKTIFPIVASRGHRKMGKQNLQAKKVRRSRAVDGGLVFTTAVVSLDIPGSGLFADFVKRLKNDTCSHG